MDIILKRADSDETIIVENDPIYIDDVRVLSQVNLTEILGVSVATIRRIRKDPDANFPPQRDFGAGVKGWVYEEIREWVRSRPVADVAARDIDDKKPEIVRHAKSGSESVEDAGSAS